MTRFEPVRFFAAVTKLPRFLIALLVLLVGSATAADAQTERFPDIPVVKPGDLLNIIVLLEPELTGEFTVHTDGSLVHPLYRDLNVGGVPFEQLDRVIGDYLRRFREQPQYSVQPLLPVVVTGQVLEGGVQTLGPGTTIVQAVTLAGLSPDARFDRVQLIRDRRLYEVDFEDAEAQWALETIRSGDQIVVERQPDFIRDVVGPVTTAISALTSVITFIVFAAGGFN